MKWVVEMVFGKCSMCGKPKVDEYSDFAVEFCSAECKKAYLNAGKVE